MSGITVPVSFDGLSLIGLFLGLLALVAIVTGIVQTSRGDRAHPRRILLGVIVLLVGLVVLGFAGWEQTYRALTRNEWVATIKAVPLAGTTQTMIVTYTPIHDGQVSGKAQTYRVSGDEWSLGGDIIKWQDYMNVLGVQTGYRITRLMGYYDSAHDEVTKPRTAYDLAGGSDGVYTFLQQHRGLIPFVRATYGNDVRTGPDPSASYKVYVSTSGYWTTTQ